MYLPYVPPHAFVESYYLCAFGFIVRNDGAYEYISSLLMLSESQCSHLSSVMMTEGHHTLSVAMPVLILQSHL